MTDNGPGLHAEEGRAARPGQGLGFALTRARLERLYEAEQRLSLTDADGGGLRVTLEIPFHTAGSAGVTGKLN